MISKSIRNPSCPTTRTSRARLRSQGLRPVEIWVPDVRAPGFRAEAHRQSLAVAASAHGAEDQAFIDTVSTPSSGDRDEEATRDTA
ncbi:MAG: antitoxin MazE family protein [Rhodospirillales bacterium]|nr:MAG: antitoxin MazE family protein [Rhodospirillales bacterium]